LDIVFEEFISLFGGKFFPDQRFAFLFDIIELTGSQRLDNSCRFD
jgi:hypothetical protein